MIKKNKQNFEKTLKSILSFILIKVNIISMCIKYYFIELF